MIQAVSNATVPQITIYCGASFGAGNYGMCGRASTRASASPGRTPDGGDGRRAGGADDGHRQRGGCQRRASETDPAELQALEQRIVDRFDRQMSVFVTSAHLLDDGVIDPRDTRAVLAKVLSVCRESDRRRPGPCNSRWHAHDKLVSQGPGRQPR
jgi:geranyl-CoA carboxylase beta subunit